MTPVEDAHAPGLRLGQRLVVIGLGSAVVLVIGLLVLASLSVRRIDSQLRQSASQDAFRGAEFIRGRLLSSLQDPENLGDLSNAKGDWLDPLLQEIVAEDSRIGYAMVVSPSGEIIAHSDPSQKQTVLPPEVMQRIAPPLVTGRWQSQVRVLPHHEPMLDCSVPIVFGQVEWGSVHLGLRQKLLEQQIIEAQAFIRPILAITGVAALSILGLTVSLGWSSVRRAREATARMLLAQRRMEVANLASGLVHEIRNPLNAMRMQIAVLRKKLSSAGDEAEREAAGLTLERLEGEVLRLQRLAGDFLDYGQAPESQDESAEVRSVLTETAELVRPEFEQAGMRLGVNVAENIDGLRAPVSAGKLRQVVLNLASNARAAMSAGGSLTIDVQRRGQRQAVISFSDTGGGIPQAALPHIFELFYTTRPGGNGMGLPIVKQIVEDAGGVVRVHSRPGEGTRFDVVLPVIQPMGSAGKP